MTSRLTKTLTTFVVVAVAWGATGAGAQSRPRSVIAAGRVIDGRGHVLENTRIVVEGSTIVAIDSAAGPVTHDLRAFTVMPGLIDSHVHITWSFGANGRVGRFLDTSSAGAERAAANARATLMGGVTTVQSVGSIADFALRRAIESGSTPGPRIITSGEPIQATPGQSPTPDEMRAMVRRRKESGADLIKIFASGGMERGTKTFSDVQLAAACDEARSLGMRTLVHAYRDAVPAAVAAGCTEIEHGLMASDADLADMARRGTFLDPQGGLLIENYLTNKERFLGTPPYDEEAFASLQRMLPAHHDLLRRASRVPGLKVVFGSDAVPGMHGRNAEELIYRVRDGGVAPMTALTSATSLAAEALGMGDKIGAIAPGLAADIIAVDGNPLTDIGAVSRVVFVMKGGVVYKSSTTSAPRAPARAGHGVVQARRP